MAGTTGILTARAAAFLAAAKIRFPTSSYAGGFACRHIIPHDGGTSDTWSEHAWGNAIDLGGSDALMASIQTWAARNRSLFGIYEIIGPGSAVAVVHVDFVPNHGGQTPPCAGGPPVAKGGGRIGGHGAGTRGCPPGIQIDALITRFIINLKILGATYAVPNDPSIFGHLSEWAIPRALASSMDHQWGAIQGWWNTCMTQAQRQRVNRAVQSYVATGGVENVPFPGKGAVSGIVNAVKAGTFFVENFAPVATMAAGGALAIIALWLLAKEAGVVATGPLQGAVGAAGGPVAAARTRAATQARAQTQRDREARSVYLTEQRSAARERGVLAARESSARTTGRRYTPREATERMEESPFNRARYERNVAAQRRRKATVSP